MRDSGTTGPDDVGRAGAGTGAGAEPFEAERASDLTRDILGEAASGVVVTENLPNSRNILAFSSNTPATAARKVLSVGKIALSLDLGLQGPDLIDASASLTNAIRNLDCRKDFLNGIIWYESHDPISSVRVLVRDATGQTEAHKETIRKECGEKYAMQLLNQIRGAIALIDKENGIPQETKLSLKEQLMILGQESLKCQETLEALPKKIKIYNSALVSILEAGGISEVDKKISFAKEISNFEDEHMHMVTKTKISHEGQDRVMYEVAELVNPLSIDQRADYLSIAVAYSAANKAATREAIDNFHRAKLNYEEKKIPGIKKLLGGSREEQASLEALRQAEEDLRSREVPMWFALLPNYKRDLISDHALEIARGTKILPTQLLADISGLRNAYRKTTAISSPEPLAQPIILGQNFHCGSPASLHPDKSLRQAITDQNIRRLKDMGGEDIILNNLTSKIKGREDSSLFPLLVSHAGNIVTTPINRWRMTYSEAGEETAKLEAILSDIGKVIRDRESIIGNFLNMDKPHLLSSKKEKELYEKLRNGAEHALYNLKETKSPLYQALKAAVEAKNILDDNNPEGKDNRNIYLNAKMQVIMNAIRPEGSLNIYLDRINPPTFAFFCKSGKDRTGNVEARCSNELICAHLGIESSSIEGKRLLNSQVDGGHAQQIAGFQGGSVGCHGIKYNPEFVMPEVDREYSASLDQKSSHFNKGVKVAKSSSKEIDRLVDQVKFKSLNIPRFEYSYNPLFTSRAAHHLPTPAAGSSPDRRSR